MDQYSLLRLAEEGLAAFPPARLGDAADWCWQHGAATGDARWCLLSRTLALLAVPFDDGEGLLSQTMTAADEVLRRHLSDVVLAAEAIEGSGLATLLDEELWRAVGR